MRALGERQILVDCDVLQADGGTRTASISGAYLALHDCLTRMVAGRADRRRSAAPTSWPPSRSASSTASPCLDLPYVEDSTAETDMNVVMTGEGRFVEVQGTAEGAPFSREELDALLELACGGIRAIHEAAAGLRGRAPLAAHVRSLSGPTP